MLLQNMELGEEYLFSTYSFFCHPLNILSIVDLLKKMLVHIICSIIQSPKLFFLIFFSCAYPHAFMYTYLIPCSLSHEIPRTTLCDLKCQVTVLAYRTWAGQSAPPVTNVYPPQLTPQEHLRQKSYNVPCSKGESSSLCHLYFVVMKSSCFQVLLILYMAPFVVPGHSILGFPGHSVIIIQRRHHEAHGFSFHHLLTVSGIVTIELLLKKQEFLCLLFSSISNQGEFLPGTHCRHVDFALIHQINRLLSTQHTTFSERRNLLRILIVHNFHTSHNCKEEKCIIFHDVL